MDKLFPLNEILEEIKQLPIFDALSLLDNYFYKKRDNENPYERVGEGGSVYFEKIRIKGSPGFHFQSVDIARIKEVSSGFLHRDSNELVEISSAVFSLFSINGLIPHRMIETIHNQTKANEFDYVGFLNILNHIFIGLLYQVWRKRTFALAETIPHGAHSFFHTEQRTKKSTILTGIEETGFQAHQNFVFDFQCQTRTKSTLKKILSHYLSCPVRILENVPENLSPQYQQYFDQNTNEPNFGDEEGIPIYAEVPVHHTKFKIEIGPLSHKKFRQFVPWGPKYTQLCRLVEDYFDRPWLHFETEFLVQGVPEFSTQQGLILGFDSFAESSPEEIKRVTFSPTNRDEPLEDVQSFFGVTEDEEGNWPKDIYNPKLILDDTTNPLPYPSLDLSLSTSEAFYMDLAQLDETTHEQTIRYIDREIDYVASNFRDYSDEFPEAAAAIELDSTGNTSHEGLAQFISFFSFVTARLRQKNDRNCEDVSTALLKRANPNLFLPIPAMMMVQLNIADKEKNAVTIPKGIEIQFIAEGKPKTTFSTCYETILLPAQVKNVICTRDFIGKNLRGDLIEKALTTLVIDLESTKENINFSQMNIDFLRLYLNFPIEIAYNLHNLIFLHGIGIQLYTFKKKENSSKESEIYLGYISPTHLQPVGLKEGEEVLPRPFKNKNNLNTHGRHLLPEFSLFPQKFMFIDIKEVGEKLKSCGMKLQLRLFLNTHIDYDLLRTINTTQDGFQIGVTPVVNLFEPLQKNLTLNTNEQKIPVLHQDTLRQNQNTYPFLMKDVLLKKDSKTYQAKHSSEFSSSYQPTIKWEYKNETLFSDPYAEYSEIQLDFSELNSQNFSNSVLYIKCLAHQKIRNDDIKGVSLKTIVSMENYKVLIKEVKVLEDSFLPTQQNRLLLKGPYSFLYRFNMNNFYYNDNHSKQNVLEYLRPYVFKSGDFIDRFMNCVESLNTSVLAAESKLSSNENEIFITNGLKFQFVFRMNEKKAEEFYLLTNILAENLSEACSDLSFFQLSYQNSGDEAEKFFTKKTYLGKRGY